MSDWIAEFQHTSNVCTKNFQNHWSITIYMFHIIQVTRASWTDQHRNDTGSVPANLWRQAMVEWRDGSSWLCDDDNDDDIQVTGHSFPA